MFTQWAILNTLITCIFRTISAMTSKYQPSGWNDKNKEVRPSWGKQLTTKIVNLSLEVRGNMSRKGDGEGSKKDRMGDLLEMMKKMNEQLNTVKTDMNDQFKTVKEDIKGIGKRIDGVVKNLSNIQEIVNNKLNDGNDVVCRAKA